jgi:membrane-associated phospholipid phosphatase
MRRIKTMRIGILWLLALILISQKALGQNGDINLLRNIHNPAPLKSDGFFKFMSNTVTPICIAVPLTYFTAGFIDKTRPLKENINFQNGVKNSMCILGSGLISYSLKFTIQRDRPYVKYPDIIPKMKVSTHSFPSGHTTFAFATATSVALIHKKWYLAVPAFVWAFGVGYSRMHLGVHYPSDVISGALVGTGTSFLMYHLGNKLFK